MLLKPRPNTAETMKSPASLWVARKPTMATSCQTHRRAVRAVEAAGMEALGCEANP